MSVEHPIAGNDVPEASAGAIDEEYRSRLAAAYVDDATWLALGKQLLEKTLPALDEKAQKLATAAGWFWTVYSGSMLVATSVLYVGRQKSIAPPDGRVSWLLVAPILTTLTAYLLAVGAQGPALKDVDLRCVADIRQYVEQASRRKARLIRASMLFLGSTALLIGIGIARRSF